MFGNDPLRQQALVAVVALALVYTCVRGVSNLKEVRRLSEASNKQSRVIADHLARLDEYRLSLSTVSRPVASPSIIGRDRPAGSAKGASRSLVGSCAFLLSVFESNQIECVGTETIETKKTDASVNVDCYRIDLQGDFQSIRSAMEEIESDLPNSRVLSCSMNAEDSTHPCHWELIFEFRENRR